MNVTLFDSGQQQLIGYCTGGFEVRYQKIDSAHVASPFVESRLATTSVPAVHPQIGAGLGSFAFL
jgi:hypothetical protein